MAIMLLGFLCLLIIAKIRDFKFKNWQIGNYWKKSELQFYKQYTKDDAELLLQQSLNDSTIQFRTGQWQAIDSLINHRQKLLVVQRTGWGKSSVYFISTKILRERGHGITIIISPLLSLMRNQIEQAKKLGVQTATINTSNKTSWNNIEQQVLSNKIDALIISPERLSNEIFVDKVLMPIAHNIGLMVIDEVHCISDWGHDFRPDYQRLVHILKQMPANMPILGTTATANNRVITDIEVQLGNINIQRGTLVRNSLALQTVILPTQESRLAWLSQYIPLISGTGIVYTLTKHDAKKVSQWLNNNNIQAKAYYSGVNHSDFANSNDYRQFLETSLLNNELKVLVATVALGMGYDKPDLSFVIHYQAPNSIISYYQQVGRAGRALDNAYGILLSGNEDQKIHEFFRHNAFPKEKHIMQILAVLEQYNGLSSYELEKYLNLTHGQIDAVLKYLNVEMPAAVIKENRKWYRTTVVFQMDHVKIQRLTKQREFEWQEVQQYINTTDCLMAFLQTSLNDNSVVNCGKCKNCLQKNIIEVETNKHLNIDAINFLKHAETPLILKKQVPHGAFVIYSFRGNLPVYLQAEEGRIVSVWEDSGWGKYIAHDKHQGYFRNEIVDAVVTMITNRWQPKPAPQWITCIPSSNHKDLVVNFSQRLANKLGIPFVVVIHQVKSHNLQKLQENRFHQCSNLDGVFKISNKISNLPMLLIDDIVDSGWTMTIATALLKQAGAGMVYPIALATTKKSS